MPSVNSFVTGITAEQSVALHDLLEARGWELSQPPYTAFKASCPPEKVSAIAYLSGKLVIQGRGAEDFVQFVLEPEILHDVRLSCPEIAEAEAVTPHGGVDESGKGDFFGPLVVSAVYADAESAPLLRQAGACDSKAVSSDRKLLEIAKKIRAAIPGKFTVLVLKPETYNRLYAQIGNLNRLLAWGHARSIENLLELVPDCPRMLSDKFGNESLIRRALMEKGRRVVMEQAVRAESDVAVAAASILAREAFLFQMRKLSEELGVTLPKGAGPQVKVVGRELLEKFGKEVFARCAKTHFKTYAELTNGL